MAHTIVSCLDFFFSVVVPPEVPKRRMWMEVSLFRKWSKETIREEGEGSKSIKDVRNYVISVGS